MVMWDGFRTNTMRLSLCMALHSKQGAHLTRQKLGGEVPIGSSVVHGVVGHPEQGASWDGQLFSTQHQIVAVAHPDLPNAHWRIHAQHFLHHAQPPPCSHTFPQHHSDIFPSAGSHRLCPFIKEGIGRATLSGQHLHASKSLQVTILPWHSNIKPDHQGARP